MNIYFLSRITYNRGPHIQLEMYSSMNTQPIPTLAAERSRRYRERKRDNTPLISIEIDKPALQGLIGLGFVAADDSRDSDCIKDGVFMLMQAVAEDCVTISDEWIERTY